MALTPEQMQALFQGISSGNQGAFSGATPGMGQDERNQWVNQYANGGTGYGQYLDWYKQNQTSLNRQGPMYQPGGMFFQGGTGGNAGAGANQQSAATQTLAKAGDPSNNGSWNVNQNYLTNPAQNQQLFTMPAASSSHPTGAAMSNAVPSYLNNGTNAQGSMNPTVAGGQASDYRIFAPGNAFAPARNSVGGATYNGPNGAGPGANPPGGTPPPPPTSTVPPPTTGATPAPSTRPGLFTNQKSSFNFVAPGWGGGKAWAPGQKWG